MWNPCAGGETVVENCRENLAPLPRTTVDVTKQSKGGFSVILSGSPKAQLPTQVPAPPSFPRRRPEPSRTYHCLPAAFVLFQTFCKCVGARTHTRAHGANRSLPELPDGATIEPRFSFGIMLGRVFRRTLGQPRSFPAQFEQRKPRRVFSGGFFVCFFVFCSFARAPRPRVCR